MGRAPGPDSYRSPTSARRLGRPFFSGYTSSAMEASARSTDQGISRNLFSSRGILMFVFLSCCWSIYEAVQHPSSRIRIPHHFLANYEIFGRLGSSIDILSYLLIALLMIELLRTSTTRLESVFSVAWIGPVVINPLRMLIPGCTSKVWWAEQVMTAAALLLSMIFLWRRSRSAASPAPAKTVEEIS